MLKIIVQIATFISFCLLVVLLNITNPTNVGPFGILFFFILAYMSSFGLMAFFLYGMSYVASYLSTVFVTGKPFNKLTFKNSCSFSFIVAAAPIMLIGLKSVGEMGFYEYLLITAFVVIGCLYVSKRIH